MKQLCTTIITLFLSTLCLSAQQIHFTDTSNLWRVKVDAYTDATGSSTYYYNYIIIDTIFNGEHGYIHYDVTEMGLSETLIFITEDTIMRKVYARKMYGDDTSRFVLYDFNMVVGDSIVIPSSFGIETHTCTWVDPDVLIDGIPHRAFSMSISGGGGYVVIEGVGSLNGPLQPFEGLPEYIPELICFKNKGTEPVFSNMFINYCYLSVADKKKSEPKITLFPNPAYGQLHISVQQAGFSFQCSVYDILGRQVYRGMLKDQLTLDIATWQSGVYLLRVTDDRGSFAIKRFSKL